MGKGIFQKHEKASVTYGDQPNIGDMVWIDQTTGLMYNYDDVRGKWLSAAKHVFEFARKGAARGMYIPLLGDLDDSEDVYMSGKASVIINVFCRSHTGDKNMGFEIRKNGDLLYEFYYDDSDNRRFSNDNLSYDIEAYDKIQVYVKAMGTSVNNTVCRIETAWRYDV